MSFRSLKCKLGNHPRCYGCGCECHQGERQSTGRLLEEACVALLGRFDPPSKLSDALIGEETDAIRRLLGIPEKWK